MVVQVIDVYEPCGYYTVQSREFMQLLLLYRPSVLNDSGIQYTMTEPNIVYWIPESLSTEGRYNNLQSSSLRHRTSRKQFLSSLLSVRRESRPLETTHLQHSPLPTRMRDQGGSRQPCATSTASPSLPVHYSDSLSPPLFLQARNRSFRRSIHSEEVLKKGETVISLPMVCEKWWRKRWRDNKTPKNQNLQKTHGSKIWNLFHYAIEIRWSWITHWENGFFGAQWNDVQKNEYTQKTCCFSERGSSKKAQTAR
jgi:hypothetical protein